MGRRAWLLVGLGGAVAIFFWSRRKKSGAVVLPELIPSRKGKQVGPAGTLVGSEIRESPKLLAEASGVDPVVYTLARMIASEEGDREGRMAVGWAARNNARALGYGDAVHRYITPGMTFGQQGTGKPKRPVATTRPPDAQAVAMAKFILGSPASDDPTGGALRWFDWDAQAALHAKWKAGTESREHISPEELMARRRKDGWVELKRLGSLVLLGPTPKKLAAIRKSAGIV